MEFYRYLQRQGLGSRKECRQLIELGLIKLNGTIENNYRREIVEEQVSELIVRDVRWEPITLPLCIMLHKPAQYETSHQPKHYLSVFSLLPPPFLRLGINAVGRLDADTTGLLLFTTDGQLVHTLTSPRQHIPKCYRVSLKHPIQGHFITQLKTGVYLHDSREKIVPKSVDVLDSTTLLLTLTEGKYHQVKRMVAAASNRVVMLHRISLGPLSLGQLAQGEWRSLTTDEYQQLCRGE